MATNDSEDYDWRENIVTFDWAELGPTLAVYGATFVLGLAGNVLIVFTTYRYRRMHSVTNVFLASLAIADLLLIIVCIPIKVAKLFSYTWEMGEFLCKYVHYIQNVSAFCSVLTLTAISIERYYAIVHPMKAKYICTISQAKRIIFITWILAFVLAAPILFVQTHMEVGKRHKAYYCVKDWDSTILWRSYEIHTIICLLIIPISIMTFAYSMICWEVWRVMERRTLMTSGNSMNNSNQGKSTEGILLTGNGDSSTRKLKNSKTDTKTTKQVIYMLVAIVFLFAICWTPVLICDILTTYDILPKLKIGFYKYVYTTFNLMAYANSCINPIVYGFMSKNFRESFQTVLCCTGIDRDQRTNSRLTTSSIRQVSRTSSQTRHTIAKSQCVRSSIV